MKSRLAYLPVASGFLVLVLSLVVGALKINSNRNTTLSQNLSTKAAAENATLALSPASGDYTMDTKTSYPVGIILNSGGREIDGVDIIINFDPKKVTVEGTTVTTTNSFEQYLVNKIDNVAGKIRLSALTFTAKPVTGIVGTFRFRPVVRGAVNFNFEFTPGATTDTNVADHASAKDILGSVVNASFNFK